MAECPDIPARPQVHPFRRRHPRHTLRSLAYVKLDNSNGGIIRDLTESGMAIHAVAPLRPDEAVNVVFELPAPRVRVNVKGRVAWSDSSGQAGIQFCEFIPNSRRALRDWLLFQIFATAAASGPGSIFAPALRNGEGNESYRPTFSAASRAAIAFGVDEQAAGDIELPRVRWGLLSLPANRFSLYVDTLVVLCAILLFSITSIAIMGGLPAWPLAAALFVTASTIFAAVYQVLFSDLVCGATPGKRLAGLAVPASAQEDQAHRFR
jgi:hypothetical protein